MTIMAARRAPLRLVIFDCDGVLIDSEAVANRVVAAALSVLGWPLDAASSQRLFMGMTLTDMEPLIVAATGRALPEGWRGRLSAALLAALGREATLVPGAVGAIDAVEARDLAWRVASNSSHEEMAVKFARTGLTARVAGRLHSHRDVGRGKPAPDVFLAAAAAEGVRPDACLVIEDSRLGCVAARAAGMDCLGYAPHGDGAELAQQGAWVISAMDEVAGILARAARVAA